MANKLESDFLKSLANQTEFILQVLDKTLELDLLEVLDKKMESNFKKSLTNKNELIYKVLDNKIKIRLIRSLWQINWYQIF